MVKIKTEIENFTEERGIKYLYHFTKAQNLHGILKNGLISRYILDDSKKQYCYNDHVRLDGRLDAICVSIEFPNYRMFYKYRDESPDDEWCVIQLDSRVLYEKECLFCIENAASNSERLRDEKSKKGIDGLKKIFYNEMFRMQLGLPKNFSTNPQAEVLVLENIGVEYIENVYFRQNPVSFPFEEYMQFNFLVCKYLFNARFDYKNWS